MAASRVPSKRTRVQDSDDTTSKRAKQPSWEEQVKEINDENQKVAEANQRTLAPIMKLWVEFKFGGPSNIQVVLVNFDYDEWKTTFEDVTLGQAVPLAIIQKLIKPDEAKLAANGHGFTQEINLLPSVFSIPTVDSIHKVLAAHVPQDPLDRHPSLRYILGAALSLTRFIDPDRRLKFVRELLDQGQVQVKLNRCGSIRSICDALAAHQLN